MSTNEKFIAHAGLNSITCHGRVTEIEHRDVFNSRFHKLVNSIFRNEPYQFSHQTSEYTIRVEEITYRGFGQVADFQLYGNYLGRLYPGDEVEIVSTNGATRRVVRSISNITSGSVIRPGIQIPALFIRLFFIILIVFIYGLITTIASMDKQWIADLVVRGFIYAGIFLFIRNWIRRLFRR